MYAPLCSLNIYTTPALKHRLLSGIKSAPKWKLNNFGKHAVKYDINSEKMVVPECNSCDVSYTSFEMRAQ